MTRKEALAKAIAATQAGTLTGGPDAGVVPRDMSRLIEAIFGDDDEIWSHLVGAHDGSIDDAFALHQAVVPEQSIRIERRVGGWVVWLDSPHQGISDNPARAWLLAILRALHSMEAQ